MARTVQSVRQGRYQDALRSLKSRLGVSHRDAQQIYRFQRERLGPAIPAAKFDGYSKGYLDRVARRALKRRRGVPLNVVFEGVEAAFSLRRFSEDGDIRFIEPTDVSRMVTTLRSFQDGESGPDTTVERRDVSKDDFWSTFFDMIREFIKDEKKRSGESPDAVLVAMLAVSR